MPSFLSSSSSSTVFKEAIEKCSINTHSKPTTKNPNTITTFTLNSNSGPQTNTIALPIACQNFTLENAASVFSVKNTDIMTGPKVFQQASATPKAAADRNRTNSKWLWIVSTGSSTNVNQKKIKAQQPKMHHTANDHKSQFPPQICKLPNHHTPHGIEKTKHCQYKSDPIHTFGLLDHIRSKICKYKRLLHSGKQDYRNQKCHLWILQQQHNLQYLALQIPPSTLLLFVFL
eukprot:TRINITY_DN4694_c0_g1_i1.p1 TRINITY_DN4694_c0_g1~~TRINITY_DN4694_c0_g1_i1.p1  ORF type:complete len:231 (+),score=28.54 TRINITY_DN4694_c0_g1_i1:131-823(+)